MKNFRMIYLLTLVIILGLIGIVTLNGVVTNLFTEDWNTIISFFLFLFSVFFIILIFKKTNLLELMKKDADIK